MLFEICNVLSDSVSARLSLEYSIDVTLKKPSILMKPEPK